MGNWKTYIILMVLNLVAGVFLHYHVGLYHDYRAYYGAGVAVRIDPQHIYNWDSQISIQERFIGRSGPHDIALMPFFHPPVELPIFSVLSRLDYEESLNVWRLLSFGFLLASVFLLAQIARLRLSAIMLPALAIAPTACCLQAGQDSLLLLLILAGTLYLLKADHDLLAGLLLSLALFKPQLPVVVAIALLCIGKKRFVAAFASSSALVTGISLAYLGKDGIRDLLENIRRAPEVIPISDMPSVRGVMAAFIGDRPLVALAILMVCLFFFVAVWRRSQSLDFAFCSALCVGSFAAVHTYPYDLVVLCIPIALLMHSPQKSDGLIMAALANPIFYLGIFAGYFGWVFVVPTILLAAGCFRLNHEGEGPYSGDSLIDEPLREEAIA